MKKSLIIALCFLLFIGIVYASDIGVSVAETLEGEITSLLFDNRNNIIKFLPEFLNSGSIAYSGRIRIDVLKDSELISTIWSEEEAFMPGDRKNFEMYWFSDSKGVFSFKTRVYFGNEIKEYRESVFEVAESVSPEDVFKVKEFRTYDDFIVFDIYSDKDVENLIIIPYRYTPGWIFEQKKIDSMKSNETRTIRVSYKPSVWGSKEVKLLIVSNDGEYSKEEIFTLEKKTGLEGFFYYIIDSLKLFFS
jgi:hypothetical protein